MKGYSLARDHDHKTGYERGALCTKCNHVLGYVKDNPVLLRKAAEYLEMWAFVFGTQSLGSK